MNENLDLAEILKYCPIGTKLYSPLIGECELRSVYEKGDYPIQVLACNTTFYCYFTKNGIYDKGYPTAECLLFPSKDNRDWSTFKVPNKLPKTWKEFCKIYPVRKGECCINTCSDIDTYKTDRGSRDSDVDRNIFPNEHYAKAMLALCQLIQLRNYYNDGWEPDWKNACQVKYCIYYNNDKIAFCSVSQGQIVLTFKTPELRDEFLKNFRALIELAKPLI